MQLCFIKSNVFYMTVVMFESELKLKYDSLPSPTYQARVQIWSPCSGVALHYLHGGAAHMRITLCNVHHVHASSKLNLSLHDFNIMKQKK